MGSCFRVLIWEPHFSGSMLGGPDFLEIPRFVHPHPRRRIDQIFLIATSRSVSVSLSLPVDVQFPAWRRADCCKQTPQFVAPGMSRLLMMPESVAPHMYDTSQYLVHGCTLKLKGYSK